MVPERYWQALKLMANNGYSPVKAANEMNIDVAVFLHFCNKKLAQRETRLKKEYQLKAQEKHFLIGQEVYYKFNGKVYKGIVKKVVGDTVGFNTNEPNMEKMVLAAWVFSTYEEAEKA